MTKIYILLAILFFNTNVFGNQQDKPKDDSTAIYMVVDKMPNYPGGVDAFLDFLSKNINYPYKSARKGVEGKVYITFVVNKDGTVSEEKVIRGVDKDIDKEALRVIKKSPKWNPGMHNGKLVNVQYTIPIVFHIPTNITFPADDTLDIE